MNGWTKRENRYFYGDFIASKMFLPVMRINRKMEYDSHVCN